MRFDLGKNCAFIRLRNVLSLDRDSRFDLEDICALIRQITASDLIRKISAL